MGRLRVRPWAKTVAGMADEEGNLGEDTNMSHDTKPSNQISVN